MVIRVSIVSIRGSVVIRSSIVVVVSIVVSVVVSVAISVVVS